MAKTKSKSTKATKTAKVSKSESHAGLFSGRLNRSGYVLGNLIVFFTMLILGIIFVPLLQNISNSAVLIFIPLLILCYTLYNFSFTLRRLHDLNKSVLWLLIFCPGYLLILLSTSLGLGKGLFGAQSNAAQTLFDIIQSQYSGFVALLGLSSAVLNLFYIYVIVKPGYKKSNKWGAPSTHWKVKEILGFK